MTAPGLHKAILLRSDGAYVSPELTKGNSFEQRLSVCQLRANQRQFFEQRPFICRLRASRDGAWVSSEMSRDGVRVGFELTCNKSPAAVL